MHRCGRGDLHDPCVAVFWNEFVASNGTCQSKQSVDMVPGLMSEPSTMKSSVEDVYRSIFWDAVSITGFEVSLPNRASRCKVSESSANRNFLRPKRRAGSEGTTLPSSIAAKDRSRLDWIGAHASLPERYHDGAGARAACTAHTRPDRLSLSRELQPCGLASDGLDAVPHPPSAL